MAVSDFAIHQVTIKRPTPGVDAVGGETIASEATLFDSIPACVQPVKAFHQYVYAQQNIKAEHAVYTDRSLSGIRNGDYLYFNSDRYVITGFRNVVHDGRVWEVLCYRYQGDAS